MDQVELTVIGAGVIGLAIAAELAPRVKSLLILDAAAQIGSGISSRNSEVIHAGIYYPEDSLKAALCVRGKALLYAYCERHRIAYRRCGKLLVSNHPDETAQLEALEQQAQNNGVEDLCWLSTAALRAIPALRAQQALLSPSTGILDSHQFMLSLLAKAESAGAQLALRSSVSRITPDPQGFVLETREAGDYRIHSRCVINAAGLGAQTLARGIEGLSAELIPPRYLCKGSYFSCTQRFDLPHLIYPLPTAHGLGIHATMDLQGNLRFGPDTEYIDEEDYRPSAEQETAFYTAIRRYLPGLRDGSLQPAYAGIRPKLSAPGESSGDFVIQDSAQHGLPGLIQLFGIESPGLTASLAIAEQVASRLSLQHRFRR